MDNQRPDTIESKPQSQSWDELNNHSLDLSEEDLISIYNQLREKHEIAENAMYYPNIKHLHATPFERKKDCAEQGRLCKESSAHTEVAQWYQEARNKSCLWWLENHVIARHRRGKRDAVNLLTYSLTGGNNKVMEVHA